MPKFNKIIMKGIYRRIVGSMSGLSNINVEVDANAMPHFRHDTQTIVMPEAISYAKDDDEDLKLGKGICVHESSHVLFCPNPEELGKEIQAEWGDEAVKDFAEWFNVFADCNNEFKTTQIFPHLREPLKEKTQAIILSKPEVLKTDNPFMQVIMRCDDVAELKPVFPSNFNPNIRKFIEETTKEWKIKKMNVAKGDKLLEFTHTVWKKWMELLKKKKQPSDVDEKIKKLMKQLGKAIAQGKSKAEIQKIEAEIAKLKGQQPGWFKDKKDDRIISQVPLGIPPNYNDKTLEELKEMLKKTAEDVGKKEWGTAWGTRQTNEKEIPRTCKPQDLVGKKYKDEKCDLKVAREYGKKIHRALRNKINLAQDFETRHRNGRIDMSEIRRQIGQMGRLYKETVFKRDGAFTRGGEWAIEVLCDCSGSMGGMKIAMAKQALATLAYALDGLPNVHYALTGFTDDGGPIDIEIKRFKERKIKYENIQALKSSMGNCDGFNIRSATKKLKKMGNMKKILVVISDGQPAYINGIEDTKKAVEEAEKLRIRVIGIAIDGACLKAHQEIYCNRYDFSMSKNLDKDITRLILSALGHHQKRKFVKRIWER